MLMLKKRTDPTVRYNKHQVNAYVEKIIHFRNGFTVGQHD